MLEVYEVDSLLLDDPVLLSDLKKVKPLLLRTLKDAGYEWKQVTHPTTVYNLNGENRERPICKKNILDPEWHKEHMRIYGDSYVAFDLPDWAVVYMTVKKRYVL